MRRLINRLEYLFAINEWLLDTRTKNYTALPYTKKSDQTKTSLRSSREYCHTFLTKLFSIVVLPSKESISGAVGMGVLCVHDDCVWCFEKHVTLRFFVSRQSRTHAHRRIDSDGDAYTHSLLLTQVPLQGRRHHGIRGD